jgi:hypothetical protein
MKRYVFFCGFKMWDFGLNWASMVEDESMVQENHKTATRIRGEASKILNLFTFLRPADDARVR